MAAVLLVTSAATDKNATAASTANKADRRRARRATRSRAKLGPVPTNHVTGAGNIAMRLDGTTLTVTVAATGCSTAPHAMHIHAGARGVCPPASAAKRHNGHLAISTLDGVPFYGPPVTALTTRGDTSPKSILAFARFLSGERRPLHAHDQADRRRRGEHPQGQRRRRRPRHRLQPQRGVRQRRSTAATSTARCPARSRRRRCAGRSSRPRRRRPRATRPRPDRSPATRARAPSTWPRCSREPTAIAALCYLGAHEEGDRTRPWDA